MPNSSAQMTDKTVTSEEAQLAAILMAMTSGVLTPAFLWLCGVVDFHPPAEWALRFF